jgi:hypothetical protein
MEYRGLHQDVEEPRDLRVRPVGVPVPLVRPSLAVQARVKMQSRWSRGTCQNTTIQTAP